MGRDRHLRVSGQGAGPRLKPGIGHGRVILLAAGPVRDIDKLEPGLRGEGTVQPRIHESGLGAASSAARSRHCAMNASMCSVGTSKALINVTDEGFAGWLCWCMVKVLRSLLSQITGRGRPLGRGCPRAANRDRRTASPTASVSGRRGAVRLAGEVTSLAAKRSGRGAGDLFRWDVAHVLSEVPFMPERVDELPVAVAPELLLQGMVYLRSGVNGALPEGVDIRRVEVQDDGRATNG